MTAPPPSRSRRARLATVAAVLIAGYAALWMASAAAVTPREQLADLGSIDAHIPASAQDSPSRQALTLALQSVRGARRSTAGLFPTDDPARLDSAAVRLESVASRADVPRWVSQEARLALGRVLLARHRDTEAARVLGGLVREGGYRAPVARRLLDAIRAGIAD